MAIYFGEDYYPHHKDETEKQKLSGDDIAFLKDLQKELNTQNTFGNSDPKFWVIRGEELVFHVDDDEADGFYFHDDNACCTAGDTVNDFMDYIRENVLPEIKSNDTDIENMDTDELIVWLEEEGFNFTKVRYKTIQKNYDDTMFLTYRDAEAHLRANDYHYDATAHPYAMTAWRSPVIERLVKILKETDWEKTAKEIA